MRKLFYLALASSIAWLIYDNAKISSDLSRKNGELKRQAADIQALTDKLKRLERKDQTAIRQERDAIAQLEQALQAKREDLAAAEQRWQIVQNGGEPPDETADLQDKIRKEQGLIHDLDAQVRDYNAQKAQVGAGGKAYQDQERWTASQYRARLSQQLTAQRQNLMSLQGQLNAWKPRRLQPDAQDHIQALQAQIKDQQNEISVTQQQQQEVNQQVGGDLANSRAQTEQSRMTLDQAIRQLQQQSRIEKATLAQLQGRLKQARQSRASRKQAFQALEQDYRARKAEVDGLEAQLRDRQEKLQELEH